MDRMSKTREKELRIAKRRRRWMIRSGFVLGGIGLGYICPMLPATHQMLCHLGAKLLALLGGGS